MQRKMRRSRGKGGFDDSDDNFGDFTRAGLSVTCARARATLLYKGIEKCFFFLFYLISL